MLANVALVAYAIATVTLFAPSSTVAVSIRPFEGLFAEAFLGSYFATSLLFAPSNTQLGAVSSFAIPVLCKVSKTAEQQI
jgi:hypothetical protein